MVICKCYWRSVNIKTVKDIQDTYLRWDLIGEEGRGGEGGGGEVDREVDISLKLLWSFFKY